MKNASYYIYLTIALLVQRILSTAQSRAWFRNSLYFKNISFLKSDIDFTVYSIQSGLEVNREIIKRYKFLKTLFPIIGELNYYNKSTIKLLKYHNKFELLRDPHLQDFVNDYYKRDSKAQAKAFILKMLSSNLERVKKGIFQKKKWRDYFNFVNQKTPSNIDDILKFLEIDSISEVTQRLEYNPVKFLSEALLNSNFEKLLQDVNDLSEDRKKVFVELIYWEFPGVIGQIHTSEVSNIKEHFKNLIRLLNGIDVETDSIKKDLLLIGL